MPKPLIIDQSDVILANNAVEQVIKTIVLGSKSVAEVLAQYHRNDAEIRRTRAEHVLHRLDELSAEQKRAAAVDVILNWGQEEGNRVVMLDRIERRGQKLFSIIDENFKLKLATLRKRAEDE